MYGLRVRGGEKVRHRRLCRGGERKGLDQGLSLHGTTTPLGTTSTEVLTRRCRWSSSSTDERVLLDLVQEERPILHDLFKLLDDGTEEV